MISVDEARSRLFAAAPRLPAETVPLGAAAGRVTAEPIVALRTQPPFRSSAMDGYAVRADEIDGGLMVVGQSAAGARYGSALGRHEAVRIFTGAPVPDGADAVLIQEDARLETGRLYATARVTAGDNIRAEGLDFRVDDVLVAAGTRLEPRHLALVGAGGHPTVRVARRPRVAFLSTGDELVPPGSSAGPDQIVASVTPALAALVERAGGEAIDLGIAPDDVSAIVAGVRDGLATADVLVTLGGASVGDHDVVRPALAELGIALDFWRVAIRPGKPLMFAPSPLVLGLPGNPVSGVVCALLFLLPLVEAMQGATPGPELLEGILGTPLPQNGPRRDHLRARRDGRTLTPFPVQDSSMLSVLAAADALIVREPDAPAAAAGDTCRYIAL
jgi:molybdopterin molybdotransferase